MIIWPFTFKEVNPLSKIWLQVPVLGQVLELELALELELELQLQLELQLSLEVAY